MTCHTLVGHIDAIRDLLGMADDDEIEVDSMMQLIRNETSYHSKDSVIVKHRADEYAWLQDVVVKIPNSELPRLVAHRGFHDPRDNIGKRDIKIVATIDCVTSK